MIANEAQWVLAIAMLAANLLWVGLRGRSLLEHYLPDSALSHLSLMWGSTVSGAAALYVGSWGAHTPVGGWGFGATGTGASLEGGTVTALGVSLASLGWMSILIDSRVRKLPDQLTGLLAVEVAVLVLVSPWTIGVASQWFLPIVAGAVVWTLPLAVGQRLGEVGLGDVKLAPVLGAALATCSFRVALLGLAAAFVAAFIRALFLTVRGGLSKRFSFGPYLMGSALGCWVLATLGPLSPGPSGL